MEREKSIVVRVVLIVTGLLFGWFCIWSGGVILDGNGDILFFILTGFVIVILTFTLLDWLSSLVLAWFSLMDTTTEKEGEFNEVIAALVWMNLMMFAFGAKVAPIGKGFSAWLTPWDLLLVLGGIPLFFVISNLVDDIAATEIVLV